MMTAQIQHTFCYVEGYCAERSPELPQNPCISHMRILLGSCLAYGLSNSTSYKHSLQQQMRLVMAGQTIAA